MFERELIFRGAGSTAWLIISIAATLTAVVLVAVLLRYERQLVSRRVGTALVALRLAVLLAVLFVWLEPVASRNVEQRHARRLIVAVDLSESMETADRHASRAEKLRWARAVGLIGNSGNRERLDRWVSDFQSGREPVWVESDETDDPGEADRLATIRRDHVAGLLADVDQMPRKEIARRLLAGTRGSTDPLLDRLREAGDVELYLFARSVRTGRFDALPAGSWPDLESFAADASNLSSALEAAERAAAEEPLSGVVLVTDGRHNDGQNPLAAAERLGELAVPVYPVLVGSLERPKDAAITSLDSPRQIFEGDRPQITATVRSSGLSGTPLSVRLQQDGATIQEKTVTPGGVEDRIQFELPPAEIGEHEYVVSVAEIPGEIRADNNQQRLAIQVVDGKARVLLIDGEARWEFRFLDNALSRDERVDVERVVFHQPALGVLEKTFFPSRFELPRESNNANEPHDSPLADVDLVIVGDVSPDDCPPELWDELERFVSEDGGTVVLTAGRRHFPRAHRSEVLDRLLPVEDLSAVRSHVPAGEPSAAEFGIRWRLSPEAHQRPLLQFDADAVKNRMAWESLAAHPWGLVGAAKPAATVLAYASTGAGQEHGPSAQPDLQTEPARALFIHQNFGYGQIFWVGVDSTWRWRRRAGDTYHHRFWGQLARLAAENRAAARHPFVQFGPDQGEVETGDEVRLQARWTEQFLQRFPGLSARVDVVRETDLAPAENVMSIPLRPDERQPRLFEARVDSLPPGEYRLRLRVDSATRDTDSLSARLKVSEPTPPERKELHPNLPLLLRLADASHGRLLLPDELHELPPLVAGPASATTVADEVLLWDHWLVLAAIIGCLSAEWLVRKLAGLP